MIAVASMDFHCEGCSDSKILEVSSFLKECPLNKVSIPKSDKKVKLKNSFKDRSQQSGSCSLGLREVVG